MGDSRDEDILENILGATNPLEPPQSRIESLLQQILAQGGGGGGGGTAGVSSFAGRTGIVHPEAGDYRANQITAADGRSVQAFIDSMAVASTVDSSLSPTSTNAVQNRAIYRALQDAQRNSLPAGGGAGDVLAKVDATDGNATWQSTSDFMRRSVYDPDLDGKVDRAASAESVRGPIYSATLPNKGADTTLLTDADKGVAGGVAPLDPNGKLLPENMPDSIMAGLTYGGIFNATTRVVELTPAAQSILDVSAPTMTLEDSASIPTGYPANAELFYVTTNGGTFAGMTFAPGDWLISLSTSWKQLQSGAQVSSVNGETGAVTLDSDDVAQGVVNLYMRSTERAKLADVEQRATRDVNVIQSAELVSQPDGSTILRLSNKNGTVTDFEGGEPDLTDYLKVDGDASDTYAAYQTNGEKVSFAGNETESSWRTRVVGWLRSLKGVAFSADYDDLLDNKPQYNGVTLEGNKVAADLGTLDVQVVTVLPDTPVINTLYIHQTEVDGVAANRFYVATTDGLQEIKTGSFKVYEFDVSPEDAPPEYNGIYVYEWIPSGETEYSHVLGIMWQGTFRELALRSDILTDYDDLTGKPEVDGNEIASGDQTHESLGLVGVDDFVPAATGKTEGIEVVYGPATPASPVVLSEIDDTDEQRYSSVHTSSNQYINGQLDELNTLLAGKLNLLFVDELPDPPTRNTQYYVETEQAGVFDIVIVDSVGTQHSAGTTEIDLGGLVRDTRKVAGATLETDVTAAHIADATKAEAVTLTNKTIDVDDNTVSNLETDNFKSTALSTSIGGSPVQTKLATEKAVSDFAVKKTSDANKVYGSSTTFDRVTSVGSSSTDTQIPTAKAVYGFAVPQTATGNRIYGTNSSGSETQYPFSDTYASSADGQLFTRKGANGLYNAVRNGEQGMVFCGNFTRNGTQSVGSNASVRILLTASDIYRTNLVQLSSNAVKISVAGTYLFRFIGRLADTAGATRAWYLGGGSTASMADDQMGGMWSYTFNRHKAEATYLKYCAAGEYVAPWVYIESNSGTLNYMTVEVFRLNNK